MTMMNSELAVAFARRLRANADHAEKQKFSVANLSTMSVGDCRALADWIDEGVVSGGQRARVPSDWRRFWIVVSEVGLVPEKKGPFPMDGVTEVIREFIAARPRARLICLTVDDSGTPHVDHAPQVLQMLDGRSMPSARKHNERVRAAEEQEGANAEHRKGLSDSGKDVSGNRERVENATPAPAEDAALIRGLQVHIAALEAGCCSCGVKSPDPQWHDAGCKVRNAAEALDNVDAIAERIDALQAEVAREKLRADAEAAEVDLLTRQRDAFRRDRNLAEHRARAAEAEHTKAGG